MEIVDQGMKREVIPTLGSTCHKAPSLVVKQLATTAIMSIKSFHGRLWEEKVTMDSLLAY